MLLLFLGLFRLVQEICSTAITENCLTGAYKLTPSEVTQRRDSSLTSFEICAGFEKCPRGYYCINGVRSPCPGGTFGNSTGLASSSCSGFCPSGSYCPPASAAPILCPDSNTYCPFKTASPKNVEEGYYSNPVRSYQLICPRGSYCTAGLQILCPAGTFGSTEGLSTPLCSGVCPEGFYCPVGTANYQMNGCGQTATFYCPAGSSRPLITQQGYYAVPSNVNSGGGFILELPCLPGSFCVDGVQSPCPPGTYGSQTLEVASITVSSRIPFLS